MSAEAARERCPAAICHILRETSALLVLLYRALPEPPIEERAMDTGSRFSFLSLTKLADERAPKQQYHSLWQCLN